MALKTLAEANAEAFARFVAAQTVKGNGIACPDCGGEMVDLDDRILLSSPPQIRVHCEACGFTGTRFLWR